MSDWIVQGLNLSQPDVNTAEEWTTWRALEEEKRGFVLPSWDLVIGLRPDAVKRWLGQQSAAILEGGLYTPLVYVYWYAINGFEGGVLYTLDHAENGGHTRAEVVDAFSMAFLVSSVSMHTMAPAVRARLDGYREREEPFAWPAGWRVEPERLRTGLDFTTPDVLESEVGLVENWYRSVTGEVPGFVGFLGRHNPRFLKHYRHRVEGALKAMPTQALPFFKVFYETARGSDEGIRDAVLLARGLGVTKLETLSAINLAFLFAGEVGMTKVDRVTSDLFGAWDD